MKDEDNSLSNKHNFLEDLSGAEKKGFDILNQSGHGSNEF